jgi:hypothetical protein
LLPIIIFHSLEHPANVKAHDVEPEKGGGKCELDDEG